MLSFTWTFYVLEKKAPHLLYTDIEEGDDYESNGFLDLLQRVIFLCFGDFGYGNEFTKLPAIVLDSAILLITLIMMNLLIAIVSDTYVTVMAAMKQAQTIILVELTLEMESLMFWNRGKESFGFIVYAEYQNSKV